ncbi:PLDc N-terminal domain-containing protein [Mycetocola sp. JXN-3]|uniref:PLDc N-terminal domain-containing protein n=1 Tax=Mycetocola sp. JXN-3 TaxID=2116510 RepID=UPI00165D2CFB|nr:PLDc N-terminal domain-containing protein [Mycetocola sp. JXN-3]
MSNLLIGWHLPVLLGVLALFGYWVYAIVVTANDRQMRTSEKVIWIVLLVLLHVLTLVAWTLDRIVRRVRKNPRSRASGALS